MMDSETRNNAKAFRNSLVGIMTSNHKAADSHSAKLDAAYGRLTSLQAWRSFVIEPNVTAGPKAFFIEAQNDGLISNVLVASGLWRSALKSLRSLTENVMHFLYYKDHPVEYQLWEEEKHRLTFKALFNYLENHPMIRDLSAELAPTGDMKNQYARLSNAVHSSVKPLRMTKEDDGITLGKVSAEVIGKWHKEQSICLRNCNILLTAIFRDQVSGTACKGLRESMSYVMTKKQSAKIKAELGVSILHD